MGSRGNLLFLGCWALVAVVGFLVIMGSSDDGNSNHSRRLQAAEAQRDFSMQVDTGKWVHQPKYIAGLCLSVLVSLTSSVDRECGSSLYLVIFSVLLNLPFRNAIAMTAFTVALGSFAPGIAAMSEASLTERGPLALLDYPSALVLLPTMFFGISWGVIINMWWPNWLLALLVVLLMAISNAQLLYSWVRIRQLRAESKQVLRELHVLTLQQQELASPLPSPPGKSVTAAVNSGTTEFSPGRRVSQEDVAQTEAQLRQHISSLTARAQEIEGMALLYPMYHVPSVREAIDHHLVRLEEDDEATARGLEDDDEQLLQPFRSGRSHFTFRWKLWWQLNIRFELSLVLKIVVLHLLTEFVRHKTTKPCTTRFWIMLGGVTGAVTCFLLFIVTSYNIRRLWRGPHWIDALQEVKQIKKQEAAAAAAAATQLEDGQAGGSSIAVSGPAAVPAVVAAGDAIAVGIDPQQASCTLSSSDSVTGNGGQQQQPQGCWPRFKRRLPWTWLPAAAAITFTRTCNSSNSYRHYTRARMLVVAGVTQVIGIMGCALGLPSGPAMATQLLWLGIKPHVVAATSRFLVMCFCFGSFVAYLIAGNVQSKLAGAYGLLNLGLAPLGLILFKRLRVRSSKVLLISLCMGLLATVVLLVWQLVPLLADVAGTYDRLPAVVQAPAAMHLATSQEGNQFDINRFCHAKHH